MRTEANGDVDRLYDQFQLETMRREREQAEARRAAEVERLDGTDYREFLRLRSEEQVTEPEIPLDEATYQDYKLRRKAGEGK
jgi:hypothetical protein